MFTGKIRTGVDVHRVPGGDATLGRTRWWRSPAQAAEDPDRG